MGRGRAKAKQIKVARKLKYSAPSTDLSALERELHASRGEEFFVDDPEVEDDELDEDEDPYAKYAYDDDDEDDDEHDGGWTADGQR